LRGPWTGDFFCQKYFQNRIFFPNSLFGKKIHKNKPNLCSLRRPWTGIFLCEKYFQNRIFFPNSLFGKKINKNHHRGDEDLILLYFEYRQIWLNTFMNHHHLSNITKLKTKTLPWIV
jgi:hypothetical protein